MSISDLFPTTRKISLALRVARRLNLFSHVAKMDSRLIGALVALGAFVGLSNAEMTLTLPQQNLLALLVATITLWIFRVMPMALTAILALAVAVTLKIAPADEIFGAFSTPTLFLLLGSFLLTAAMSKHRLAERMSVQLLLMRVIGGSTRRIVIAFGLIAALLSTVLDNGAVAAILMPIGISIARTFSGQLNGEVGDKQPQRGFLCALLLMIAYGSTVGALMTPLGDASNLVAWEFMQRQSETPVSIGIWLAMALPICIVLFVGLCFIVLWVNPPEIARIEGTTDTVKTRLEKLGPMSQGEKNTIFVFLGAVAFWLLPSFVAAALGQGSDVHQFIVERLPPSVVAIIAAAALFVLPAEKGHLTMEWEDTSKMNFGPLFLVGATLAMGSLLGTTGLAAVASTKLATFAEAMTPAVFYAFAASIAILFSELTTNLVSVTVLVPLIPGMSESAGADTAVAMWIATFAAIYGFMLPISTSANAIVYGSGEVPMRKMIQTGFFVDLSGIVIVVAGVIGMSWMFGAL